jgi:dipeptidyl aminopeptidase/acylaminoacyl peptidase
MRHACYAAVAALVLVIAGCFPITVSVGPDGRIALVREEGVVIYDLKAGEAAVVVKPEADAKAAWVMFSKDGKRLLYVLAEGDQPKDLYVCNADGTGSKKLHSAGQAMAYALWSPDGKYITAADVSGQAKEGLPNLIDLQIINASTGETKKLVEGITQIHDWLPDSSGVVAFVASKKAGDQGLQGQVVKVALDGKQTPLLEAIVGNDFCIDASNDGKQILLTASVAAAPGTAIDPPKAPEAALYGYAFARKAADRIATGPVASAFFSPDDKHVLVSRSGESKELIVMDPDGKNAKTLASDALTSTEGMMDAARVLPVWLSNDTVLYWRSRVVVGFKGTAINTMTIKIDGAAKTGIQAKLDNLVEAAAEKP